MNYGTLPSVDDIVEFHSNMDMIIHNKQFYPTFIMILTNPFIKKRHNIILYFKIYHMTFFI